MTLLKFPVAGPLDSSVFPHVESYDATAAEPSDWRLNVALESASSISLQAVCNGWISTVPPNETLTIEFGKVNNDVGSQPNVTHFYLIPDSPVIRDFKDQLESANLGDTITWFIYKNVDTQTLSNTILQTMDNTNSIYPDADQTELQNLFLAGHTSLHVRAGEVIGFASTDNARTTGNFRMEFGVHNKHGYLDPVAFYQSTASLISEDENATLADFESLVFSAWPFVAEGGTIADLTNEASQKLYPNAVLQEAIKRLSIEFGSSDWRLIADAQKSYYLNRLYNNINSSSGPYFVFSREEMVNPFQLESIAEFFCWWPDPGTTPLPSIPGGWNTLNKVNFSDDDFHLVLIDPFNDPKLGSPDLPKPDWQLNRFDLNGSVCDNSVDVDGGKISNPDSFEGTLFLVYKGTIESWYRWSSYTSHRWEDDAEEKCASLPSSIQGNIKYKFRSRYSNNRKLNFCFVIWYDGNDSDVLTTRTGAQSDYQRNAWVPGRFYFRQDASGIPTDPDGKTWVLLHFGHTIHDQISSIDEEPDEELYFSYSGSGGCMVSPVFYRFRRKICSLYLGKSQNSIYNYMRKIEDAGTHDRSMILHDRGVLFPEKFQWEWLLSGTFWLVRPDEPNRK